MAEIYDKINQINNKKLKLIIIVIINFLINSKNVRFTCVSSHFNELNSKIKG